MELTYDYSKLDHPDICRMLFYPRLEQVADHGDGIALQFEVKDGVRVSGYFFAVEDKNAPTILFFHGNGEIAAEYSTIARFVKRAMQKPRGTRGRKSHNPEPGQAVRHPI